MVLLKWHKVVIFIALAIISINFLEIWGITGIIIFLLILATYKLYKKRDAFEAGLSNIETMIWGKPLNKDYWDKGELKNTKIKLSFGKSKWFSWKHIFYLLYLLVFMIGFIILWRLFL